MTRFGFTRQSWWLPLLSLVAAAQALAYFFYLRDDPGNYNGAGAFGDQVEYIDLGQQLLRNEWAGHGHYMPGYPALLALCQVVFGDPRLGMAIVQAILFAGLVILVANLAERAFGPAASPWAAALVALNPSIGYSAGQTLTEFLTGVLLTAVAAVFVAYARSARTRLIVVASLLMGTAAYIRSELLGFLPLLALIAVYLASRVGSIRRGIVHGVLLGALVGALLLPWMVRNAVVTGNFSLHEASPVSNLLLMGTWFRVFDETSFAELQRIQKDKITDEEAVRQAAGVGSRPDLAQRYMAQARGPYELPLGVALGEAAVNVQMNLRQFLVNHFVLAPVLIWAGHTPVRQADAASVPSSLRWMLWGTQFLCVLIALAMAIRGLRSERARPLSLVFLSLVLFISGVHLIIAVDDRFTLPALPLVQLFAGAALSALFVRLRQRGQVAATVSASRATAAGGR